MLKFILTGFIFAQVLEFQFNILITKNYSNWVFTLIYYPALLVIIYLFSKVIDKIIKRKKLADIFHFMFWGAFGLFIMEWVIIGNSPTGNPDAIQIGMLAFWLAVTFMPRIFINQNPRLEKLKHSIKKYFTWYAIITTILAIVIPMPLKLGLIVWLGAIGYVVMFKFYYDYFKLNLEKTSQ